MAREAVSAAMLVGGLVERGVRLWAEGEQLRLRAEPGVVTPADREALRAAKAEVLALLAGRAATPMSSVQRRLWFLTRFDSTRPAYLVTQAYALRGPVEADALARALAQVVARHEALRATFAELDGYPVQLVLPAWSPLLMRLSLDSTADDAAIAEAARDALCRPFALDREPPVRACLIACGAERAIFVLAFHHLVIDGASLALLAAELGPLYAAELAGAEARGPAPALGHADFVAWERRVHAAADSLEFWRARLAELPVVELPQDRPRPPLQSYRGRQLGFNLPGEVEHALQRAAADAGVTRFAALLAVFLVTLQRLCRTRDLVVGTPHANRDDRGIEGLIGCLVSTVVLRVEVARGLSFRELLRRVDACCREAFAHKDVGFERLVELSGQPRDPARTPLFSVFFGAQGPAEPPALPGAVVEAWPFDPEVATFDLECQFITGPGGTRGTLTYTTDLFEAAFASRFVEAFVQLAAGLAAAPAAAIDAAPMLDELRAREVVLAYNRTAAPFPRESTLSALIREQAARTPEAPAVTHAGRTWRYSELAVRVEAIAAGLRERGVGPGQIVAVLGERSAELLGALLGVLAAGAAYLPLDPAFPEDRLRFMIEDSGATLVIRDVETRAVPGSSRSVTIEALSSGASNRHGHESSGTNRHGRESPEHHECLDPADRHGHESIVAVAEPANHHSGPEDPAYVLYTSGSTGTPKGVVVRHRNLVSCLSAMARGPGIAGDDVLLSVTTWGFDIAALELFLPLTHGARLVLADTAALADGAQLQALLAAEAVTVMQATPATWSLLVASGWRGDRELRALCGGEHPPRGLVDWLASHCAELWNMYGPTETTIWSTRARLRPGEPITLGRPIENTQVFVLDPEGQPLGPGAPGELWIAGEGVAAGYLGRPELTAARFVDHNPAGLLPAPIRCYRTGDLVRLRDDGQLEFLGRLDDQVKIRGHRIEIGEIEHALSRHPAVREAAVAARPGPDGERQLVAFVCAASGQVVRTAELLESLRRSLPAYMLPARVVVLPELPRTPNGKLHRQALLTARIAQVESEVRYAPPADAIEAAVAELFAELLPGRAPGRDDDFFALGGHSLLAARLLFAVKQRHEVALTMTALFQAPTVAGLASAIKLARLRAAAASGDLDALTAMLAGLREEEAHELLARLDA
ncbi:amino acid adenylation domain-containing protein [Nannocystis sp. ILAH1]|uniref:non-ribosomal peptide synthetase n=1 Tax=Nannocystis sp. ILAH1 TaxID=2996789 RepID=UPI00226F72F8|nr:amino acid adenylation domain-containing protein [Nannocystis sp. ILAH1]MCY0989310.1 amino acid adenylation domain-containing protein [Nannocystis sp. ILAH1]